MSWSKKTGRPPSRPRRRTGTHSGTASARYRLAELLLLPHALHITVDAFIPPEKRWTARTPRSPTNVASSGSERPPRLLRHLPPLAVPVQDRSAPLHFLIAVHRRPHIRRRPGHRTVHFPLQPLRKRNARPLRPIPVMSRRHPHREITRPIRKIHTSFLPTATATATAAVARSHVRGPNAFSTFHSSVRCPGSAGHITSPGPRGRGLRGCRSSADDRHLRRFRVELRFHPPGGPLQPPALRPGVASDRSARRPCRRGLHRPRVGWSSSSDRWEAVRWAALPVKSLYRLGYRSCSRHAGWRF